MDMSTPNMRVRSGARWPGRGAVACAAVLCLAVAGCAGAPSANSQFANRAATPLSPTAHQQRARLRNYFLSWAGVPYEYGGTTRHGIDCSAFVKQAVAATEGVRLPRTTMAQARDGYRIAPNKLRIGDLVFFRIGGGNHVGIYVGDNRFMHASSSLGVTISSLDNSYWRRHFWQARRVL